MRLSPNDDRPMTSDELMTGLPGEQLVRTGIADLTANRRTVASLLVSVAGARLARGGLWPDTVAAASDEPEIELYRMLRREGGDAYARYNAFIRELVSFEQALDRRMRAAVGSS
jgi:hypothetical protein